MGDNLVKRLIRSTHGASITEELIESFTIQNKQHRPHILVADDSSVARDHK
jgi:hypothetical protein